MTTTAGGPVSTTTVSKIVTFRLADDLFAADIYAVERVLRYEDPTTIPNAPTWLDGVIDYHKRVVPVLNLRQRFELPAAQPTAETRVLVFNVGGEWVAGIVDAVLDVAPLDAAALAPPPSLFRGLRSEFLRGIVRRGDRLVIFLDVDRLLSTDERIALREATAEVVAQAALEAGHAPALPGT